MSMLGIEDSPEQLAERFRVEKKANNIFILKWNDNHHDSIL